MANKTVDVSEHGMELLAELGKHMSGLIKGDPEQYHADFMASLVLHATQLRSLDMCDMHIAAIFAQAIERSGNQRPVNIDGVDYMRF